MTTDAAAQARLFRRVSWRILPLVGLAYIVALIDRSNIGLAALQMNDDLKFSAAVYAAGASAFFITYALLEVPANLMMLRIGAKRWIVRIMITWGLLSTAMAAVREPWQFYGLRMLIGAAEAGFFPTAIYFVSTWYPPERRGRAISAFYLAFPVGNLVMGALAALLMQLDGLAGLRGWQWMFILEGLPSVALGLALVALLPDSPAKARWLSRDEADWLTNAARAHPEEHGFGALFRMLLDLRVLVFGAAMAVTFIANSAMASTGPIALKEAFALKPDQIAALVSATGLIGMAALPLGGWVLDHSRHRFAWLALAALGLASALLVMGAERSAPVAIGGYLSFYTFMMFTQGLQPALPARYLHGARLGVAIAGVNTLAQFGAFSGPLILGMAHKAAGGYADGLKWLAIAPIILSALALWMPSLLALDRPLPETEDDQAPLSAPA
ncbi:MFS transporter [uncultured Caulobacter sp.]|uniref:MFS transporter n=1 Tax=uncultured Caulobacter sp. TaxID=158749 RepID=UPI002619BF31|nr:MFS transporter [uncultured Caulobacter sp.]